jgi:hypothetical protein
MATIYETEDGKLYHTQEDALQHLRYLAQRDDNYRRLLDAYNNKDWDTVLSFNGFSVNGQDAAEAGLVQCIAKAYKNGDYASALRCYFHQRGGINWRIEAKENLKGLKGEAYSAGKMVWEKKNGREMTDADMRQLQIEDIEKTIASYANESDSEYVWFSINDWESVMERKITQAEQIRIFGRPLPVDKNNYYKDKYSSSSSTSGGTSIIIKILGAVIGAVIGGILLKFLPSWIAVIGGGIEGWFLGATLKKKFIVIGIIAVVVLLAGQRIVGFVSGKLTSSETTTEQTAEE